MDDPVIRCQTIVAAYQHHAQRLALTITWKVGIEDDQDLFVCFWIINNSFVHNKKEEIPGSLDNFREDYQTWL